MLYRVHPAMSGIRTLNVSGTDCTGSCNSRPRGITNGLWRNRYCWKPPTLIGERNRCKNNRLDFSFRNVCVPVCKKNMNCVFPNEIKCIILLLQNSIYILYPQAVVALNYSPIPFNFLFAYSFPINISLFLYYFISFSLL